MPNSHLRAAVVEFHDNDLILPQLNPVYDPSKEIALLRVPSQFLESPGEWGKLYSNQLSIYTGALQSTGSIAEFLMADPPKPQKLHKQRIENPGIIR